MGSRFDIKRSGNRGNAHGAAHVAHGAIVAKQVTFCGLLVMAMMLAAGVVGCVRHVMLRRLGGLRIALADRHAGRGKALQRQPQHDEDQNEVTQKKRHFFLFALRGYVHEIRPAM